eukprot:TRINITY_DN4487_c0_g6_i3.p4 TRINITY_DN4487_c0_g6~~TRINITY_DN4487_c0_g6_i3.p4  ORF type:complete len:118 (+),score=38.31 TRINITY_DN4487_c0_g6_i3:1366-1719(+)
MSFMRQKQVIFDLDKRELGIVPANCSHDANEMTIPKFQKSDVSSKFLRVFSRISYWIVATIGSGLFLLFLMIFYVRRVRKMNVEVKGMGESTEFEGEDEAPEMSEDEVHSVIDEIVS